ncbi:N-acetylmuramidase domain-containing protein [Nitratireductor basaltis]|uniref:N-acetylmuramidase domain-containing protein n=1 Tax=Nitratireductor basaltis TaxID=472175 RepID=UPI001FCBE19F|nr:N-acetylmuramidase domain-containing protein [Nitratireductor basaltis]
MLALIEVESGGRVQARIDGRNEPMIRFEGHYFHRRLSPGNRARAVAAGLASPKAGGVRNPPSQKARWRLLKRACEIDAAAACESTSWGVGQIMGAHWKLLGFSSVDAFVEEARSGLAGQLRLMLLFLEKNRLLQPLMARDWQRFARGYNGRSFARNGYHLKLAFAYRRNRRVQNEPDDREGLSVKEILNFQNALNQNGAKLRLDGIFGPATRHAVLSFQRATGLPMSGRFDSATRDALSPRQETPSKTLHPLGAFLRNTRRLFQRVTRHRHALRAQ